MSSTRKGVITELNDFPIMLSSFSLMISNATIIFFAILPSNNAPGTITGSVFHQQSINNLKPSYVLSLSQSPDQRERSNTFNKHCGRNKARTCDLMGMNHASYLLLYPAILCAARTFMPLKYHLFR